MIVVDASALTHALVIEGAVGDRARARLSADLDQHAPGLIDLEVIAAVRRRLAHGKLDERRADQALVDLSELAVVRYPHVSLISRIWTLRDNLTPYDAAYVALAELLGVVLVTSDAKLAGAPGPRCPIDLLA